MIFGKSYNEFLNDLAARESEGKYDAQNTFGFSGKYQMGEAALIDAGYYNPDGTKGKYQDWIGTWTGKDGINSIEDFLSNATAQESAIRDYMAKQWQYIERFGLEKYVGQTIGGIEITESGLLAAAHLKGVGSLKRFLTSGGKGTFKDGYGTDIREYLSRFSDYDVPFDGTSLSEAINNLFNKINDIYNSIKNIFTTASTTAPRRDPLILDLDRDGTETIGVDAGAYFDHDANGFAEQTGWVSPDDGLLAMDRNGNGGIDTGRELFGDNTILKDGSLATDGLQALADLDSNNDNKIDSQDAAFSQLRVWKDANSDFMKLAA